MAAQYWYLTLPPLLAMVGYIVLLTIVFRAGVGSRLRRFSAFFLFTMALWSFPSLMLRVDPPHIVFWYKMMIVGTVTMPWALLSFTRAYLGLPHGHWMWLILAVPAVLIIATAAGYMVDYVRMTDSGRIEFGLGQALPIYGVYWFCSLGYACWSLVGSYRRTVDPVMRNRIRYPLLKQPCERVAEQLVCDNVKQSHRLFLHRIYEARAIHKLGRPFSKRRIEFGHILRWNRKVGIKNHQDVAGSRIETLADGVSLAYRGFLLNESDRAPAFITLHHLFDFLNRAIS